MNFLPPPNQPINLLRSIAKVRVELSDELKKFVEVTPYQPGNANTGCVLNYKHAVGYLAPLYSYYQTRTDVQSNLYQDRVGGSSTGAFTNEYIHQFANAQKDQTGHAPFFKDENGAFYIYMYEHQINEANISMQFHWTADALQKDPVYHTYTLHFADYEAATQAAKNKVGAANWKERPLTDEELQPYKFPVMRNHYYTYTITKLNPLELKYEVCDWINKPDIDIVFGEVGVSSITLNPTEATLKVDETINLTATVLPSAATNKSLTWTSSNPDVATVSEDPVSRAAGNSTATVTAIAPGEATITATANDGSGATATCAVTVKQPVTSITLTNATVEVNKTITLTPTILPENAADKSVTWSTSNANTATVENGVVTGKVAGTVTITATANDGSGVQGTCTVTVKNPDVKVTGITLNQTSAKIPIGYGLAGTSGAYCPAGTLNLSATVAPANATNKGIKWTSSNTKLATVDQNGVVKAVSAGYFDFEPGTVTITAEAADGSDVKATCSVEVFVRAYKISAKLSSITIKRYNYGSVTVLYDPTNTTYKELTVRSSDSSVATASYYGPSSSISIYGAKKGTATITATTTDGSNRSISIKVTVN